MYAIVKTGGKQYRVQAGDVFDVEKLPGQAGDTVELPALFLNDGSSVVTDADALAQVKVVAQIVEQHKGEKTLGMKFKKRKGYKRTKGHRQQLTKIAIIDVNGETADAPTSKAEPVTEPAPKQEAPKQEAPAPEPEEAPVEEAAAEEAAAEKAAAEEAVDLSKLTVAQLKDYAKDHDIKIPSSARKAEIVEIIENAQ